MDFEALKRLDKTKDTVKKLDKYIQTLSVDSNDYYKALCYKASVLHSLKNDEEALKILLPLEKKLWILKNEEIITLCDILKDIYYDLNEPDNALKYIKIKEEHLLIIDHDKYTKDMIEYYHFINDTQNEKRQILIYLEENINEDELIDIYERLIDFSFEENNKNDFDKYYDKLREYYLKVHNQEKITKIDYYKCHFLLESNIIDAYNFATKKLENELSDNEKTYYANICIKYFMAQEELRKASIVDSNFQDIALKADKKYKLAYLETTYELYKRLNNRFTLDLIEEEIEKANSIIDEPQKEKKPTNNKQIQKKLDIINNFEDNVEESNNKQPIIPENKNDSLPHEAKKTELKPRIDVTLNTYASGYYKMLNDAIKDLNEISKTQREPIRKALIEINKEVKFSEVHILYKKQDGFYGYQFKDGRLYDKSFKDVLQIKSSLIYQSYINQEEFYTTDNDFDIVTNKESLFSLKIILPFLGPQPLGAIAFFFKEEIQNIDFEILKVFSYILSEFIKRQINEEIIELDDKLKDFYLSKENTGYIKIFDNILYLNDVACRVLDINVNIINLDEFYELIGINFKSNVKGIFERLASGQAKSDSFIYSLSDKRIIKSSINVYDLRASFIAVMSIEDITAGKAKEAQLINESLSDALVNIKSFKALDSDIIELYKTKKFSIMLMDAKNFKKYNDVYGLKFHNDLIKAIGLKLDKIKDDYKASIYHYDSDKFFIIINNNDERNTIKIFNKMLDKLSEELFLLNNRVRIFFNGAILRVLLKTPKYPVDKIIEMLSNTLLGLKESNEDKNNVAYYNSEIANKAFYDFQMELHLSEAIDKGLIRVTYNQIGAFKTKDIFAYEARIQLDNTLVSIDYFENIIKKRNLENMIDRYVVTHSLMELNDFKKKIGGVFKLIIPIHSVSLNSDFIDFYYDKLRFLKINPKNIYLQTDKVNPDLNLKYVNLIVTNINDAIKYHAKFYLAKYNDISLFELHQVSDFLHLLNIETMIYDVSSKEDLNLLTNNDFNYITGNVLKGDYTIEQLILTNSSDKTL